MFKSPEAPFLHIGSCTHCRTYFVRLVFLMMLEIIRILSLHQVYTILWIDTIPQFDQSFHWTQSLKDGLKFDESKASVDVAICWCETNIAENTIFYSISIRFPGIVWSYICHRCTPHEKWSQIGSLEITSRAIIRVYC